MNGSLDTNVVLRLLVQDIPEQTQQAVALVERAAQMAVADVVFVESAHVLERYYRLSRLDIDELLRSFMQLEVINCNRSMLRQALEYFTAHPALSFEDCCLAVYAELDDAQPLYTFDKKLAAQLPQVELVC